MGQVTSYYKGNDGFFYGKYDQLGTEGILNTNVDFGPGYKVVAPGGLPPFPFIYHLQDNAVFIPKDFFSTGLFKDKTFKDVRKNMYIISSLPKGLINKDDPVLKEFNKNIEVPKSFCLNIEPCPVSDPDICCGNGDINDVFKPLNDFVGNTYNISAIIISCSFLCVFCILILVILMK